MSIIYVSIFSLAALNHFTYFVPDMVVPNGVSGKFIHNIAVFVHDDVNGHAALTVMRGVIASNGSTWDTKSAAY